MLNKVVAPPADFLNVPALLNSGDPALRVMSASVWTSNVAPDRLLKMPSVPSLKFPVPLRTALAELFIVRLRVVEPDPLRVTPPWKFISPEMMPMPGTPDFCEFRMDGVV